MFIQVNPKQVNYKQKLLAMNIFAIFLSFVASKGFENYLCKISIFFFILEVISLIIIQS